MKGEDIHVASARYRTTIVGQMSHIDGYAIESINRKESLNG